MAQNNIVYTFTQLDALGATLVRRQYSLSDTTPTVGDYRGFGVLPTAALEVVVTLPITQCRQVVVKNTHATAKITVKWTPTTGAEVTVAILGPGDAIGLWSQAAGTTYGISTLKLTGDTTATTFELFLGG